MLKFLKVTLADLKIWKVSPTFATSNFQGLFSTKFNSKSSWFEEKKLVCEGINQKKKRLRAKLPRVKWG